MVPSLYVPAIMVVGMLWMALTVLTALGLGLLLWPLKAFQITRYNLANWAYFMGPLGFRWVIFPLMGITLKVDRSELKPIRRTDFVKCLSMHPSTWGLGSVTWPLVAFGMPKPLMTAIKSTLFTLLRLGMQIIDAGCVVDREDRAQSTGAIRRGASRLKRGVVTVYVDGHRPTRKRITDARAFYVDRGCEDLAAQVRTARPRPAGTRALLTLNPGARVIVCFVTASGYDPGLTGIFRMAFGGMIYVKLFDPPEPPEVVGRDRSTSMADVAQWLDQVFVTTGGAWIDAMKGWHRRHPLLGTLMPAPASKHVRWWQRPAQLLGWRPRP